MKELFQWRKSLIFYSLSC